MPKARMHKTANGLVPSVTITIQTLTVVNVLCRLVFRAVKSALAGDTGPFGKWLDLRHVAAEYGNAQPAGRKLQQGRKPGARPTRLNVTNYCVDSRWLRGAALQSHAACVRGARASACARVPSF